MDFADKQTKMKKDTIQWGAHLPAQTRIKSLQFRVIPYILYTPVESYYPR